MGKGGSLKVNFHVGVMFTVISLVETERCFQPRCLGHTNTPNNNHQPNIKPKKSSSPSLYLSTDVPGLLLGDNHLTGEEGDVQSTRTFFWGGGRV